MRSRNLNLNVLRHYKRESPLGALLSDEPLKISRRGFLASAIASLTQPLRSHENRWVLAPGLEVELRRDYVSFRENGLERFVVDARNFCDKAHVQAYKEGYHYFVKLSNARFPGLRAFA